MLGEAYESDEDNQDDFVEQEYDRRGSYARRSQATPQVNGRFAQNAAAAEDAVAPEAAGKRQNGNALPAVKTSAGSAGEKKDTLHKVEVPVSFTWYGPSKKLNATADSAAVPAAVPTELLTKPLLDALASKGLSVEEGVHIAQIHVKKVLNTSKSKMKLHIQGANGKNIDKVWQDGAWSTVYFYPGEKSFEHLNDGDGLLLLDDKLDFAGEVSAKFSPATMRTQAQPHKLDPTKVIVPVDLSGFFESTKAGLAKVNQLGKLLLANTARQMARDPKVDTEIAKNLPQMKKNSDAVAHFGIEPVAHYNGHYDVLLDKHELDSLIDGYESAHSEKVQRTSALHHHVVLKRVGGGDKEHIGDISGVPGVTSADIDRAERTPSHFDAHLVYTFHHPGTKAE
jgi:hypothetical protein